MPRASTSETAVSPIKYQANTVSLPVSVISQVATAGAVLTYIVRKRRAVR